METILRFEFDQQLFYPRYTSNRNIIIRDPSHIPSTGDAVDFCIEDHFQDDQVINAYREMIDGKRLIAERLNTRYGNDQVEILVILYREDIFNEQFPYLFNINRM